MKNQKIAIVFNNIFIVLAIIGLFVCRHQQDIYGFIIYALLITLNLASLIIKVLADIKEKVEKLVIKSEDNK